jgi:tetratricopeptide (TPR) repeat protein
MQRIFLAVIISITLFSCKGGKDGMASMAKKDLGEKERVEFGRLFIEGNKEKILGNYEAAESLLAKAAAIDPSSAAVHYELGLIYNYKKDTEAAFKKFELASKIDPFNYWYKLSYATFLESNGEIDKAIDIFTELAEQNPSQIELKYELSKLLVGQKKYLEGVEILNEIEERVGVNEEISFLKQRIYLYQNDVDGAANEIKNLIASNPNEIRYYGVLSDIYLSNGRKEDAYAVFQKMKDLDPTSYFVQFSLAEYHRSEGNQEKFLEELKLAFENPEMNIDDKVKYVLSYYQVDSRDENKKAEGISICESITIGHPENAKSHALYADFLYFDNQTEKSKTEYMRTVELDSSRFPVWNQMLVIFSETNDTKNLVKYGARAIELFPNQPTVYLLYGIGLGQEKKYKLAIESYEMGRDVVIDNNALKAQFYSSLGDTYNELKEYKASDSNFDKALELDPNNVYVLNNYSYYLSVRNEKLELAKEMSSKSNNIAPNQSSFQDTYAWILFKKGEFVEASKWIDKALVNDGSSSVLLEHKGDILFKLNKIEEAVKYWEKAKLKTGASKMLNKKIEDKTWYE